MLADSLFTAQGKVGSRLKVVLIGTLAPMATSSGQWWHDLITDGTKGRTHVQHFKGEIETWDKWATIRRANPLITLDAHTRRVVAGGTGRGKVGYQTSRTVPELQTKHSQP